MFARNDVRVRRVRERTKTRPARVFAVVATPSGARIEVLARDTAAPIPRVRSTQRPSAHQPDPVVSEAYPRVQAARRRGVRGAGAPKSRSTTLRRHGASVVVPRGSERGRPRWPAAPTRWHVCQTRRACVRDARARRRPPADENPRGGFPSAASEGRSRAAGFLDSAGMAIQKGTRGDAARSRRALPNPEPSRVEPRPATSSRANPAPRSSRGTESVWPRTIRPGTASIRGGARDEGAKRLAAAVWSLGVTVLDDGAVVVASGPTWQRPPGWPRPARVSAAVATHATVSPGSRPADDVLVTSEGRVLHRPPLEPADQTADVTGRDLRDERKRKFHENADDGNSSWPPSEYEWRRIDDVFTAVACLEGKVLRVRTLPKNYFCQWFTTFWNDDKAKSNAFWF